MKKASSAIKDKNDAVVPRIISSPMSFTETIHQNPFLSSVGVAKILALIAPKLRRDRPGVSDRHPLQIWPQLAFEVGDFFFSWRPKRRRKLKHIGNFGKLCYLLSREYHSCVDEFYPFLRHRNSL